MRLSLKSPLILMSVCGVALAGPAFAGGGKGHHGGPGQGAFKMMDTNNDGKITASEHEACAKKMFGMMDTSKDGKVTAAEMEAAEPMMGKMGGMDKDMGKHQASATLGDKTVPSTAEKPVTERGPADKPDRGGHHMMSAAEKIKVVDTDGDGILTAAEHDAGAKSMFEKMDADKDGTLSKSEMMAGHAKLMAKPAK